MRRLYHVLLSELCFVISDIYHFFGRHAPDWWMTIAANEMGWWYRNDQTPEVRDAQS